MNNSNIKYEIAKYKLDIKPKDIGAFKEVLEMIRDLEATFDVILDFEEDIKKGLEKLSGITGIATAKSIKQLVVRRVKERRCKRNGST